MIRFEPFDYRRLSAAVRILITLSFALYLAQLVSGRNLVNLLGLTPSLVVHRQQVWQIVTYMFLHDGFFHLLLNMFVLWMFGQSLERSWGMGRFILFFLAGGIGGGILQIALNPHSVFPVIGASAAIYALLAATAIENPDAVVYMYFLFPLRIRHLVALLAVLEFIAGFSGAETGRANLAHLGGLVTGIMILKGGGILGCPRRAWGRILDRLHTIRSHKNKVEFHELSSEIDRILDKINRHGINNLTEKEQSLLQTYSKTTTKH
ncbi:MAG TPA: rhomboid family intramembrane serine protease [Elusimicrobiota bacterium]|nr:rhomboid family intramembrane serine protease [Elusimicrobiota bacterium]